jgi:hypothetical protein
MKTHIESIIWAVEKEMAETKAIGTKIYFLPKGTSSASLKCSIKDETKTKAGENN